MTLRPYQETDLKSIISILDDLESELAFGEVDNNLIILSAPVSYGKSIVLAELARTLASQGKKVMLTFSYSVLVQQFINLFEQLDIDFSVIAAGFDKYYDESKPIQIAMYQTLNSRIDKLGTKTDILLSDEIQTFTNTQTVVNLEEKLGFYARVGVTGTPYNARGFKIPSYKTIQSVTSKDMLELGYTSHLHVYTTKWSENIDISSVSVNPNGEFSNEDLDKVIGHGKYIENALQSIEEFNIKDQKTLLFAQNINQAEEFYNELSKEYSCELVHSKINKKKTKAIIECFSKHIPYEDPTLDKTLFDTPPEPRLIEVLISVGSLGVGFSVDDIDNAIVTRMTNSMIVHEQFWIGRMKRKHIDIPHKRVLDLGQNFSRLGGLDDDPLFEPVNDTLDSKTNRENIYKAISKISKPLLGSILPDNLSQTEPFQITNKWYKDRLQELHDIEMAIFEEKEQQRLAKLAEEKAKRDKLNEEQIRQAKELEPFRRMVQVIKTTDNLKTLAKAYLFCHIFVHGLPVSKTGFTYTPKHDFIMDKWTIMNKYPEKHHVWLKALRTRAINLIKKPDSKIFALAFFPEFLVENYERELELQNSYSSISNDDIDISDDEIPF